MVVCVACALPASALEPALDINQYAHTAWSFREGFAQGRVTAITQTPDGYLWLGTEFGLLRFDGVQNVPWRPPADKDLPDSWIRSLLAAADGRLWIGTLQGLASWKDGKLTVYPELQGHSVDTLATDGQGTVWAGGYVGLSGSLCSIANGSVHCVDTNFGHWVGALYHDRTGALWATSETGLWRWQPPSQAGRRMAPPTIASSQALDQDADGALLVAFQDGLRRIVDGKTTEYRVPEARVPFKPERILRDRDGSLWIGTLDRGLLHVHHGRTDEYTQAQGLTGNFVTRLFEDREGNIWVATKNGLDRFRDLAVRTISDKQGLPSAPPWSVLAARDGSVWLGTADGLSRWDDGRIVTFRTPRNGRHVDRSQPDGPKREIFDSGLPDDGAGTLFEDDGGRLWVSTLRGVAYFENGRFVPVRQLPAGRTSLIVGDGAGNVWVANDGHGVYRLHGGTVTERLSWTSLGSPQPATALVSDGSTGGVWVGFSGRVAYVKDGAVRVSFPAVAGRAPARVNDIRRDRRGALWIATDRGLSRLDNGQLVTLTTANGLPCDAVHWSVEAIDGSVWLYLACGLVRVSPSELNAVANDRARQIHTTIFDASDGVGLRGRPALYRPQIATTTDGQLWFLPGDGVSVLDPRHLPENRVPPPVHVEQIRADGTTYAATPHLQLPPLVRELEIDFTGLSLVAPEKNRFRVRLAGRDADWQDVGTRRHAFYADLPPGRYRFHVTGANNSGVWNEAGAFLEFAVAPAYYQTAWFRAGLAAGLAVLGWALYRLRVRRVARRFDLRLEERVNERMRIARELHDTLLQSFQGLMLRFQSARNLLPMHPAKAADALDAALERGDDAIVEGRDAIQNLRSAATPTRELTEAVAAFAEEFAAAPQDTRTPVAFSASMEGTPRQLHPLLRDDIYRIACEALRNAYRHAQASRIEAEVTYGVRHFRVRIRDDGKGIESRYLTTGLERHWGLTSMRERARQIGSELTLWSEAGAGTEVELRVPGVVAYHASRRRSVLQRVLRKDTTDDC